MKTFINYYKENSELLHHLDEEQILGTNEDENKEDNIEKEEIEL